MATTNRTRDTATTVARRRARVAQLHRDGASQAAIARTLGVSKDVVYRDIRAIARDTVQPSDQQNRTQARHGRDTLARRATEARDAMRDLGEAVAAVVAARPSHVAIPSATARDWAQQLRDAARDLSRVAKDFAEYHPTTATPTRD